MRKLLGVFLLLVTLAISAILIGLTLKAALKNGDSDFVTNVESIQELKTLDAAWSLATLSAYNTPDSNFDQIAGFLPRIREARIQLENSSLADTEVSTPIRNKLSRFLLLIEGKEAAIEHFKSNFAVVRNSLRFFPLASQTLGSAIRSMGDEQVNYEIASLYERVNAFLRNPDEGSKIRLLVDLSKVNEKAMSFPPEVANPLGNFTSHARVLVERKIELDTGIERLTGQEVIKAGDELLALYKDYQADIQAAQQEERQQEFFIILGLIILLTMLGLGSAFLLWLRDLSFSRQLAAGIVEKTEHYENAAAEAGNAVVDKSLGESLEGMGRMAATLAHEINTPLGYLGGNLQVLHNGMEKIQTLMTEFNVLQKDLSKATDIEEVNHRLQVFIDLAQGLQDEAMLDELPEIAEDMQGGIDQIQHIIDDIKNFTRKDRSSSDWFDIRLCIESAVKMSQKEIPAGTRIDVELSEIPEIYGSPAEVNQVLINMINNAAHAIDDAKREQGVIRIKTSHEKNKVMVSVKDNGLGFDEQIRRKIFDPFYTTKDVGKGTGLGLAIVRRIVTSHGGKVLVKSIPGKGTNFVFVLPIRKKAEATEAV